MPRVLRAWGPARPCGPRWGRHESRGRLLGIERVYEGAGIGTAAAQHLEVHRDQHEGLAVRSGTPDTQRRHRIDDERKRVLQ
jgi:hypothetical protein